MVKGTYSYGLGRRKRAQARVRLSPGHGRYSENGRELSLPDQVTSLMRAVQLDKGAYDISVKVKGGGMTSQREALLMGLARALLKTDESFRKNLRSLGRLTRDPREKERKKPGLKRARRAPQFSKR